MGRPKLECAKKTSINIRVTDEQRRFLKDKANKYGLNLSEYILKCCMQENQIDNKK